MVKTLSKKQIQAGWQVIKFGEIAKNISERVDPVTTDLKVYVGLGHLDPQSLRIARRGVPSDVKGQKLRVRPGQIIFGKRRAYQKKLAVADFDGICSAHAMVLEAIPGKIIPELLPFFMQSDMFMDRAVAISEGSLSPTIKWKTLKIQKFPLPPLERQKEILEVLEKVEAYNKSLITSIEAARRLSVALEQHFLTNKNQMKRMKLKECSNLITKGASPKWQGFKYVNNGTLFVTSENVRDKKIDIENPKFVPNEFSEKNLKRSMLKRGDVLINLVGASIGRAAIWTGSVDKANINQAVALVRPMERILPEWILLNFYSQKGQKYFGLSTVENARPNISLTAVGNFELPVPDIGMQKEIVNLIENSAKASLERSVKFMATFRSKVSNTLFNFI